MSKAIYKFPLKVIDQQTIELPFAAQVLCVQTQKNSPVLYALLDIDDLSIKHGRTFHTFGTGNPINAVLLNYLAYIGAYQLNEGSLVFHVFEEFLDE